MPHDNRSHRGNFVEPGLDKGKNKTSWSLEFLANPILKQIHKGKEREEEEEGGRVLLRCYIIGSILFSLPM